MKRNPLSQQAVNKAVLTNSLQHPIVLYSTVAGMLAAVSGVVFHLGSLPLILSAGGAVTALAGWMYEFIGKRDNYSQAYFAQVHAQLMREKKQKLAKLREELNRVQSYNGIKQLDLLELKYRNFEEILLGKLAPTEMTYSRYLSIAEQVYLAILDNLDKVYLTLKSISAVDREHLAQRLNELQHQQSHTTAQEQETLQKRLVLYQQQSTKASDLILANERALTELDEVTAKLAGVEMNKGRADVDLEMAMEELRQLAERSDRYAR